MSVTWVDPTETHSPRDVRKSNRIAAVDPATDQISRIFTNCMDAAKAMVRTQYFTFDVSQDLTRDLAKGIANAANIYHNEFLGYYWKWVE